MATALDLPAVVSPASTSAARRGHSGAAHPQLLQVAASASVGAGIIHVAAVAGHAEHRATAWTFLAVAVLQVGWGCYALARARRWVAVLGAVLGVVAVTGWLLAKARGIWFIGGLDGKEPIRLADGAAAALGAASTAFAVAAAALRRAHVPRLLASLLVLAALAPAAPASAAALARHPTSTLALTVVPPRPFDPALPIDLSGVPGVTPAEQARAENLLSATIDLLPRWADPAYDEANGFVSIGDGFTGIEHYLNPEYMADNVMLDPTRPESLVFDTTQRPKKLVAAMYMATPGMTLAQVPNIGGALTQWHVHGNLCFDGGAQVRGLTNPDGTCRAPLVKGPEIPMIHVWIEAVNSARTCGPFAALEGVAGGQVKAGEAVACDQVHAH